MNTAVLLIFQLIVFLFSVIIHEVSHGYVAEKLGDPTARLAGRLTLNPISHIDPMGSIIVPLFLYITTSLTGAPIVFGWAKPVPYNPYNLRNPQQAAGKIAFAGPAANLLIALVFGLIAFFLPIGGTIKHIVMQGVLSGNTNLVLSWLTTPFQILYLFAAMIVFVNVLLAIFNLVPIPPLDGSKVLFAFLPMTNTNLRVMRFLEQYGMVLIFIFIFFGFQLIFPIIGFFFNLFMGFGGGI